MSFRFALMLACVSACHHGSARAPEDTVTLDAELAGLCERVTARTISAWSQPVYRSRELVALTPRVDAGEPTARCELGELMRSRRVQACRGVARGLRSACT